VEVEGGGAVTAARAWSTLPLTVLARLADPAPPPDVLAAAAELRFRAILLVYLVLDADRYTPFDAHYLPEAWTPVARVSEPKNYRDGDDPPGRTVLCAEIPCASGDALWRSSDDELGELVASSLGRAGLPPVRPVETVVRRLPSVYPVYRVGYARPLEALDKWASAHPRLLTFGRGGLFAHDNAHHALAMGWAAADALGSDGTFDEDAWREARARFAEHVVED
jgi:protoporphyrinogen oxidase